MEKIEGVPDGWRLVRITSIPKIGEYAIGIEGNIIRVSDPETWDLACIVERTEPPKPTYRPFANAAEFEPHRDKWICNPRFSKQKFRAIAYDDSMVWLNIKSYEYSALFESGTVFEDGTPFGVMVAEEYGL